MSEPSPVDVTPMEPKRRAKWPFVLAGLLLLPVLLATAYTAVAMSWSYSEGERAGVLQKFSRRGWVCKTYEGELAMSIVPGVAPTIWTFTVRDAKVAERMNAALGKRVALHYREHRGVPTTCFGDTQYFVDSVRVVE